MYVVGVFGGGAGSSLTAGKGFAILTVVNPSAKVKRILTWERYKNATANVASQITIMSEGDATPGPAPAASKLVDVCYLPSIGLLLSNDPTTAAADCQTALNSLGLAGWK
jgi:hypothetical protein